MGDWAVRLTAAAVDEREAREHARHILDRPPFDPVDPPRPFRGVLRRLGEWLEPVGRPLGDAVDWVGDGGPVRGAALLVVFAVAVALAARAVRTRTRAGLAAGGGGRRRAAHGDDPDALERAADDAERAGDLAGAVRLRFRAGVLRLAEAGAVELRPSLTTGALVRQVRSPVLRDLARTFDAVAYGGRAASAEDVAAAREGWRRVLDGARTQVLAA